jgi:phage tail-like protein
MTTPSVYLRHLPQTLQDPPPGAAAPFVGEYLKIVEAMLAGRADATAASAVVGVETAIDQFPEYLDPARVPVDDPGVTPLGAAFLAYLASWVGLVLDQNWDLLRQRRWLQRIVSLYKRRGTAAGLTEYLHMFVGDQVQLEEPDGDFVVGGPGNVVGVSTYVGGAPAHFFRVLLNYGLLPDPFDVNEWFALLGGTRAIVDLEKPAHTYYLLDARTSGFIVARRSTVARDTLLWERSTPA